MNLLPISITLGTLTLTATYTPATTTASFHEAGYWTCAEQEGNGPAKSSRMLVKEPAQVLAELAKKAAARLAVMGR